MIIIMSKKDYEKICDIVATISPFIRFVGAVGEGGELLAYKRRQDLLPLLNAREYTASVLTHCHEDGFGIIL